MRKRNVGLLGADALAGISKGVRRTSRSRGFLMLGEILALFPCHEVHRYLFVGSYIILWPGGNPPIRHGSARYAGMHVWVDSLDVNNIIIILKQIYSSTKQATNMSELKPASRPSSVERSPKMLPSKETSVIGSKDSEEDAEKLDNNHDISNEYVTGIKLALIVASVALACFLMLLDTMVVSTVSNPFIEPFRRAVHLLRNDLVCGTTLSLGACYLILELPRI